MTGPRVAVVGAGPGGLRAAQTLVDPGLRPIVIDEGARAGGQIYRCAPEGFTRPARKLYGPEAGKACALRACFDRMLAQDQLDYLPQPSVLCPSGSGLQVLAPVGLRVVAWDRLIIAIGATDRLAPVPGWHTAGVFSLGAAQTA